MKQRYERNCNTLTPDENDRLAAFKVCVVGCGGIGGYAIEMLVRLGIGQITAIDGDKFEVSNLNRQILSHEGNLGFEKAYAAAERAKQVNSDVEVTAIAVFLDSENANEIIRGHDVVIDALDNMSSRRVLETACAEERIPLIHGAIAGWYAQIAVILPGENLLHQIYPEAENKGAETKLGNPAFTPALAASLEVAECIKLLLGKGESTSGKIISVDVLNQTYDLMEI